MEVYLVSWEKYELLILGEMAGTRSISTGVILTEDCVIVPLAKHTLILNDIM